jgi:uncharacterized protein
MPDIEQARAWYPHSDPVHGFDHILRVYHLASRLAEQTGADLEIVQAAALLHDAHAVQPHTQGETRADHQQRSADFAKRVLRGEGWSPERIAEVQHCIRSHRFRDNTEQPQTLEAKVLFDADKLDAIGATGVARAIAYAAHQGNPAYIAPSQQFLDNEHKVVGERHSAYHEYLYKLRKLKERLYTQPARAIAAERHRFQESYFERLIAEASGEK